MYSFLFLFFLSRLFAKYSSFKMFILYEIIALARLSDSLLIGLSLNSGISLNVNGSPIIYVLNLNSLGFFTKIEGTITVYKKVGNKWIYVASNSDSSTRTLSVDVEFDAVSGVTYKAVAEVTAYSSSGSEPATSSKIATCP